MYDAEQVVIGGHPLHCGHCGKDQFLTRGAMLEGWLSIPRYARVFVCATCGHLEWFLHLDMSDALDEAYDIECVSCGATIPAGQTACSNCGWTYLEESSENTVEDIPEEESDEKPLN